MGGSKVQRVALKNAKMCHMMQWYCGLHGSSIFEFTKRSSLDQLILSSPVPPSFQNQTVNVTVVPSLPITLPCSTSPDPTLSFSWSFNGVTLLPDSSGGALVLTDDGGLVLSNVQSTDEGVYTCTATNNLGSANGTVYLDVLSKWVTSKCNVM